MNKGFTLVEIMIVLGVIGLLAVIAIPSFMRARTTSQQNACINNLRQIEAAKDQYALEYGLTNNAPLTFANIAAGAIGGYLRVWPNCPASTNSSAGVTKSQAGTEADYEIGVIGSNALCRIMAATHVRH